MTNNEEGKVAKNGSRELPGSRTNQEVIIGVGYINDSNLQNQQMQLYN